MQKDCNLLNHRIHAAPRYLGKKRLQKQLHLTNQSTTNLDSFHLVDPNFQIGIDIIVVAEVVKVFLEELGTKQHEDFGLIARIQKRVSITTKKV